MLLFYPCHATSQDTWHTLQPTSSLDQQPDSIQRVVKGKYRKAAKVARAVYLRHIPYLILAVLQFTCFLHLQRPGVQVQVACVGVPRAGVLCDVVAALAEFLWSLTHDMMRARDHLSGMNQPMFVLKYVDSRLNLLDRLLWLHLAVTSLETMDFYCAPIALEPTNNDQLFGFTLHIDND